MPGSASDWLKQISLATRPISPWVMTRHQDGISALVTRAVGSRNVGCFLRLHRAIITAWETIKLQYKSFVTFLHVRISFKKKSTMTYLFDKSVKRKKMLMFPVTKEKLLQVQFNHKCLLLDRSKYNYIDCKDH